MKQESSVVDMVPCVSTPEKTAVPRATMAGWLRRLCSFPAMLTVLLACIVFLVLPKAIDDPDIYWHLRNTQVLLQTHHFLHTDLYSFTTGGRPWMDPEWLAEVPFYLGWRWMGERGIFLVQVMAIEAVMLGIFALGYLQSKNAKAAFLMAFAAIFLGSVSYGPRTLLFGWILLVAELAILYRFADEREAWGEGRRQWLLWLLPPLFCLWVNFHGSWMIGLVVLALFALSGWVEGTWGLMEARRWSAAERRTLAAVFLLSVLALFANPYGWRLVAYPFDMAFRQKLNVGNVQEWRSLDFHALRGRIVLGLMAGAILLQLARRRTWKLYEVAFLLLALDAALTYERFLFLAAILMPPLLAKDLARWMPYERDKDKPWLNAPIIVALIATMVTLFPTNAKLRQKWAESYPLQALPYLQQFHPAGNVFEKFEWGGYMIWHVRQVPVFMDSRLDIFEHHGVLQDYLDAVRMKRTFEVFEKYHIRYVLFPRGTPLVYLLRHTPGWKVDYQDKTTVLFERMDAMPRRSE